MGGQTQAHIPLLDIAFGFAGRTFNNFMSLIRTSSVSDSPYSSERPDSNVEDLLLDIVNVAIEKYAAAGYSNTNAMSGELQNFSIFRVLFKRYHSCIVVEKSQLLELCC